METSGRCPIFLPVERFQKRSKSYVWSQSTTSITNSITQFSPDTLRSNITDFAKGGRYNVEIIPPTAIGLDLGVKVNYVTL